VSTDKRGHPGISDRLLLALLSLLTLVFERLSIDRATSIGAGIGRTWFRLAGPRTRRVYDQIACAFADCDDDQKRIWARDVFEHFGRSLAELILLRGRRQAELLERVRVDGLDNLEAADGQTEAGGVLIVTAHLGNWELACAKIASLRIPVSVVYRGVGIPALDDSLFALRRGEKVSAPGSMNSAPGSMNSAPGSMNSADGGGSVEGIPMGPRAGIRVARALSEGRKVLVLLDQNARRQEGVFVDFFGRPACTRSGPLSLSDLREVPVLPAFVHRDPDGRRHRLQIHPALQLESGASDDEEALRRNVQRVTAVIEKEIRVSPGQWIWTHRRWRTQPVEAERGRPAD
jgi:KDO2-lipid IV(A) lauroyltransferase